MNIYNIVLGIVGPTGVGKTETSLYIAENYDGEIINADSMQIYKFMDIGTAKPTKEQLNRVKHHLIDIIEPDEAFNVKNYVDIAEKTINEVRSRNKLPILVGGTGLYYKALLYGIFDAPDRNEKIRKEISEEINKIGLEEVHKKLSQIDRESGERIHPNDEKRIIRALEVYRLTGKTISKLQKEQKENFTPSFNYKLAGLSADRDIVYNRIESRCDKMLEAGLIDEVKKLRQMGYSRELQSMKAIGYSHIHRYLDNEISYEEMVRTFKRDSRRYAKRQWTLFNAINNIYWIDISNFSNLENVAKKILIKLNILVE
ncbi:MAG: tRNA (adenosine(37)-N6)-dimethylallyltransferase MiaA [Spirochaetota bacterium]